MPREMRPEPSFFFKSWEYSKGLDYYCTRWFADVPESALAVGERSSQYLFGGSPVAARIYDALPDIKVIFVLRNPILRAWANYRFTVLEGLEDKPFDEALKAEPVRMSDATGIWKEIQPHAYIARGFYGAQIQAYLEYFDRSNILILKSEDLAVRTTENLRSVYSFLGVTEPSVPAVRASDFSSSSVHDPRIQFLAREYFGNRFPDIVEAIRQDHDLEHFGTTTEDLAWVDRVRQNLTLTKDPIPPSCTQYLRDIYEDDIHSLSPLVEFEPKEWLGP